MVSDPSKVTLAVLKNDLLRLTDRVEELSQDIHGWMSRQDARAVQNDKRLSGVEADMRVVRYVGGVVVSIVIALLIAFLTNFFGV